MELLKRFWYEEDGIGIVELVLILVILVGLVALFNKQITGLLETIIGKITGDVKEVGEIS